MRAVIIIVALLMLATPAAASDIVFAVKTPAGQPVKDAVVMLTRAGAPSGPIKFDWPMTMQQKNLQFDPFVLVAPVGADVSFPNRDKVRHHVYSFSPTKRFELKLYGKDESRSVRFEKAGVVALGCNIHDSMTAFIRVVDTPYAAKTDAAGQVVLHDVPGGAATLRVWHPYLKVANNEIERPITVPVQGQSHEALVIDVRPPPPPAPMVMN